MKTKNGFAFLAWALIISVVASCQSAPLTAYAEIPIGAKKAHVLSALGGPNRTYRKNGVEHWVYKMQSASGAEMYKELLFQDGIVVNKLIPDQTAKPQQSDYEEIK